jgi:hypothetical protein
MLEVVGKSHGISKRALDTGALVIELERIRRILSRSERGDSVPKGSVQGSYVLACLVRADARSTYALQHGRSLDQEHQA